MSGRFVSPSVRIAASLLVALAVAGCGDVKDDDGAMAPKTYDTRVEGDLPPLTAPKPIETAPPLPAPPAVERDIRRKS